MASSSCRQVRRPVSVTISNGLTPRVVQRRAFWASSSSPAARPSRNQAAALQADADVDEGDGEGVGQVLEVVGDVAAVAAGRVQEVDVVDHAEPDVAGENGVGGLVAEFLGVALVMAGQAEEPAEHRVERPLAGGGGQADVDHGYPVVPAAGERAVEADLPLVEFPGECLGDGRLAEPGVGVDDGGALDLVPVLPVGFHDVVQVLVDGPHLRGAQRPDVGVPYRPALLVLGPRRIGERADLGAGQRVGPLAGGSVTNSSQPRRVDSE